MLLLRTWVLRAPIVVAALLVAHDHQVLKVRDQKWFFGRACRNIRDQHIRAGELLAELQPHRVLVGDAGALVYASNRPGLDIIGLGGYHDLPFARAGVHGLAASIELIERMPPRDRPDVFAIYPSWWGILPTWFASDVVARIPAPGNVICGGYEDVIYKADWHVLNTGDLPRVALGELRDAIDFADLVSEKEHAYTYSRGSGWTDMKILPDLADDRLDIFDGGRILYAHATERFTLRQLDANKPALLVLRTAPTGGTTFRVRASGAEIESIALVPHDGWVERVVAIPAERSPARSTSRSKTKAPASSHSSTRGLANLRDEARHPSRSLGPPTGRSRVGGVRARRGVLHRGVRVARLARERSIAHRAHASSRRRACSRRFVSLGYVALYLRGGPRIIDATTYALQATSALARSLRVARPVSVGELPRALSALPRRRSGGALAGIFPPG